ncbi:MAG: hypothetical protein HY700_18220 [Gemmatimonadetes bacterium]|nr:hypothetical protein [Gemmatimonadota bacterium]
MRTFVALLLAIGLLPRPASAQQGSAYLPLGAWEMPYVEHLIRAGIIRDPDPLTRPLRRADVLSAVRAADTSEAPRSIRATVRKLDRALSPKHDGPVVGLHFYAGPSAGTFARRDPLREDGNKYVSWQTGMEIWTAMGPLSMSSEPFFDRRLRFDPDYPGDKTQPFAFRFTNAYVSLEPKYAQVAYGSVDRNWGPPGIEGLVLSSSPYSYDHFYLRLGVPHFRVESVIGQLDDLPGAAGTLQHRWWSAHRFVFKIWPWMTGVLGQGTLWRRDGPTGATWFLNPTRLAVFSREDDQLADSANTVVSGDLWLRLPSGVVVQAQGLIDDLSLFHTKTAPNRLAGTLLVDVPVGKTAGVRALWTVVSSITYRTFEGPVTYWARHGIGLARNFDDYSQWTLSATMMPAPHTVVTPELTLLLQGEGDLRKPTPELPIPKYPFLLVGTTERTVRLGFAGRTQIAKQLDVSGNAGLHFIANRGNVAGASDTRLVGALTVNYRFGGEFKAP